MSDDFVRAPDVPVRERLVDNSLFDDVENQIQHILEMSENEYISQQYQEIQQAEQQQQNRMNECIQLTHKVNKMLTFDKINTDIYETILTAFSLYQSGDTDTYTLASLEEYERTMRIIKSMRMTKEEQQFISRLFTYFDNCV